MYVMKKLTLLCMTLLCTLYATAQPGREHTNYKAKKAVPCSKIYFDINTGLNNNGGLLGGGIDAHLGENVSINGGVGLLTTWGYKVYLGGKYFFNPCHKGWALGLGATYSTGMPSFSNSMETQYGTTEPVTLKLLPQLNATASVYKYWKIGRNNSRIYLQLGWSQALSMLKFEQVRGTPISPNSAAAIGFISPGGLIAAFGFSFGVKRK